MPKKKEELLPVPVKTQQVVLATADTKAMAKIKKDMAAELVKAKEMLEVVTNGSINTEDDYKEAQDLGAEIKKRYDTAVTLRTVMTAPMDKLLKEIRADFKPVVDTWDEALTNLKLKGSKYLTVKDQIEREKKAKEQKAIDDETEKQRQALLKKSEKVFTKDPEQAAALVSAATQLEAPKLEAGPLKGEDGKKVPESLKFEVTDWSKVPVSHLLISESSVREAGQDTLRAARDKYNAGKMTENEFEAIASETVPGIHFFYVKQARF
jgi:hypothetical protein